ncbi:hypothetical protein [Rhizobium sp. BK176]|uniref:hypothetical protein n=1 Tax=Rhizobium sp. BK176 TaxID=2587071 RepID=UPI0021697068|nr:hypothetical protein [Rhizobium sp. BK176]MCS4088951.1 hypothetical protein [Rhizobium sp. BK176]
MIGIQNAVYAMAIAITRRLVGRRYTTRPRILAIDAETVAVNAKTIGAALEVVGHIETLAQMRRSDTTATRTSGRSPSNKSRRTGTRRGSPTCSA